MKQERLRCPQCGEPLTRPADEGGTLVRNRFIRVTPAGEVIAGCPRCDGQVQLPAVKLGLRVAR